MIGRLATGTSGFGIACVSGRRRVPSPAAITIALIGQRLSGRSPTTIRAQNEQEEHDHHADRAPDHKVADLGLAEFGRKEITLAEHEMPGPDAHPRGVRRRRSRSPAPGSPARCT